LTLEKQGTKTTFEFNNLQHVQQPMIQKVVEYFLDRSPNPCTASEGVDVMKMMDALAGK
jgi:hypothetical protein